MNKHLDIRLRLDYINIIKHRSLFPLDKDVLSELSPLASFQIPTSALTVRRNLSFAIKVLVYCTGPRLFCGVSIKFTIHIIPFIVHPDKCQITKPRNYLHRVIKTHRVDFISGTHHLNRHHLWFRLVTSIMTTISQLAVVETLSVLGLTPHLTLLKIRMELPIHD